MTTPGAFIWIVKLLNEIKKDDAVKYLGVFLDEKPTRNIHVNKKKRDTGMRMSPPIENNKFTLHTKSQNCVIHFDYPAADHTRPFRMTGVSFPYEKNTKKKKCKPSRTNSYGQPVVNNE